MARRYEVTDTQWEIIKPYLGNTPKKTGRPQSDNRKYSMVSSGFYTQELRGVICQNIMAMANCV